jgi:hypothetical protein
MPASTLGQKLNNLAKILEAELSAEGFRECTEKQKNFDKARYFYIWIAFNHLNATRVSIRDSMPCYGYGKTVYQVIRRMYLRRKDSDLNYEMNQIKKRISGLR